MQRSQDMKKQTARILASELVKANLQTKTDLEAFKRKIAKEMKIPLPNNIVLLSALKLIGKKLAAAHYRRLEDLLRVRPVRSLSGIVNVSVLTKPYPCPGNCLYCPSEAGFPKSYLSGEPAAERAKQLKFNPYIQVKKRLENLAAEGHNIDKIELRVIGGTWSFYPKNYQEKFIAQCFAAANDYPARKDAILPLEAEQKKNETAKCRIVGISVETRPDYINATEIARLRRLGVTRVELGIQSVYDDVLEKNQRGHNIAVAIAAAKLLKNAGFKISYQIMLNLYGSSPRRDLAMAKKIFGNQDFRPDLLKIYPCTVLPEAPLRAFYENKKYQPYSDKILIKVIKNIKKITPPWVRIERIIRDIPSPRVITGAKGISNLRQIIAADMAREHWQCHCIRCREIKGGYRPDEKIIMTRRDYSASGGMEIFLSFENEQKTKLFSLLRLRIAGTDKNIFPSLRGAGLIREIHTYGLQTAVGQKATSAQHTGLGKKLIMTAEKIAREEFRLKKIAAISGVGARAYWRKNGYKLRDTYMIKKLREAH